MGRIIVKLGHSIALKCMLIIHIRLMNIICKEGDMDEQPQITSDDKLWALLAYVLSPLVPIIILLMEEKKDRPFIRAHNAQALAWGLVNVVGGTILSTVLFFCFGAPSLIIWAIGVFWGFKAYQGEYVTIPVITDFVNNQGWV